MLRRCKLGKHITTLIFSTDNSDYYSINASLMVKNDLLLLVLPHENRTYRALHHQEELKMNTDKSLSWTFYKAIF